MNKRQRNFTLTDEAHGLIAELAKRKGISMSAVIELMARETAKREGLSEDGIVRGVDKE